ncbi:hypothetical protein QTP88_013067 [Uroleucon formosanum]
MNINAEEMSQSRGEMFKYLPSHTKGASRQVHDLTAPLTLVSVSAPELSVYEVRGMQNDGAQSTSSLRCHLRSGPSYYQRK